MTMVPAAVIVVCVFVVVNFAYSTRLAYTMAVNGNDGGYPIFGHVLLNFFVLLAGIALLSKVGEISVIARAVAVASLFVVPALNACLIVRLSRFGDRRREKASRS